MFQQAYQQFQQKQYEAAIGSLQQALTIYRAISDSPNGDSFASRKHEAEVLFRLGDTYKQVAPSVGPTHQSGWGLVKDYSKAIEFYQQALAAYRAIGDRNKEAEVLISLGNAYKSGKLKSYPRVIDKWKLPDVDLVVLSACRTAASGQLGSGEEILGFGYQIQRTGAEAAIASLWYVSDGGTQALMDAFYTVLQTSKTSKAEALRQAQIALITGNYTALGQLRGIGVEQRIKNSLSSTVSDRLSHPYYWAPFILIGNGL